MKNFYENFECGVFESFGTNQTSANTTCHVHNITSERNFNEVFKNITNDDFEYFSGDNIFWCSDIRRKNFEKCQKMRNKFNIYQALIFENSNFEKFPSEEIKIFESIKNITAVNVGLTELNRNDLQSFKSLEILDLRKNKLTYLGSLLLFHLPAIKHLNLQINKIERIDDSAFDESGKNLTFVDLSHNRLKEIDEKILNAIGKNLNTEFHLLANHIERITKNSISKGEKLFNVLNLRTNRLKDFNYNCTSINFLSINWNSLENFEVKDCKLGSLELAHNKLKSLKVGSVFSLKIMFEDFLTSLTFGIQNLKELDIRFAPNLDWSYENIRHARKLEKLHVMGMRQVEQPRIGVFSEMTDLKELTLSKCGLQEIEYGMFSYQKKLELLDISGNDFESIDFNMFSSMKELKTLRINGNKLTKLDDVKNIKKIFPKLEKIDLFENDWNCSYLVKLIQFLDNHGIAVEPHSFIPTIFAPNVMGIGCIPEYKTEIIQPITVNVNEMNATLSKKLNETITKINELQFSKQSFAFDFEVLKNETFNMQKNFFELKSIYNNSIMMQKDKIDELQNELNNIMKITDEGPKKSNFLEIFLIIILAAMFFISIFYAFSKIKNGNYIKNDLITVRARAANTLDATIEVNEFQNQLIN
ncbi:hypothetical protein PVAND_008442 [Polypedilum vanderplanki]|uniref:Uncharacterized protein n=1 Tax=Polypedilum vanderplanki TaxID=319348 RepID=A0A9J6CA94_POLVA|nr:hypothetical protein PVAND_008442 [Polypedilum vanderplanki]